MTGHTPFRELKHKAPPGAKKVLTYQEVVILERWYVAFTWLHSRKTPLWRRLSIGVGRK